MMTRICRGILKLVDLSVYTMFLRKVMPSMNLFEDELYKGRRGNVESIGRKSAGFSDHEGRVWGSGRLSVSGLGLINVVRR